MPNKNSHSSIFHAVAELRKKSAILRSLNEGSERQPDIFDDSMIIESVDEIAICEIEAENFPIPETEMKKASMDSSSNNIEEIEAQSEKEKVVIADDKLIPNEKIASESENESMTLEEDIFRTDEILERPLEVGNADPVKSDDLEEIHIRPLENAMEAVSEVVDEVNAEEEDQDSVFSERFEDANLYEQLAERVSKGVSLNELPKSKPRRVNAKTQKNSKDTGVSAVIEKNESRNVLNTATKSGESKTRKRVSLLDNYFEGL